MLVIIAGILLIVIVSGRQIQQQSLQQSSLKLNQFSLLSSQLERHIEKIDWAEANSVDTLIEKINTIAEIKKWEIVNSGGLVTKSYIRPEYRTSDSLVSKLLYLPNTDRTKQSHELIVHFQLAKLEPTPQIFTLTILFLIVLVCLVIAGFMLMKLKWVSQLEDFSKLVLTADDNRLIKSKHRFHNIIGHAISQLIMNNTYLVKTKTDLTNQIRKTTYIDEVTELGNHLFFKAELQVRLHNHDEIESGIVMILSFVESHPDKESLSSAHQVHIAEQLKVLIEDIDNSIVARLKDSEFVLLLPNFTAEKIDIFCKKLVNKLSKSVFNQPEEVHHFLDIGISTYKQGFDYYHVMAEADLALRNAQLQGSNNWYVYGEPLSQNKSKGSLKWRSFLRGILDQRRLLLFTQQLHYFNNDELQHYEILVRIRDGEDTLSAGTFLAMAHQCGLSSEFDSQIISSVIKHVLYEQRQSNDSLISINIFVPSLLNQKFTGWLLRKISSYPELSKKLVLEISENLLLKHIEEVSPVIIQLSQLGIKWCVEHFDSIGAAQTYLDKLPISMVKIDRRIINNIAEVPAQQLLFNSIVVSLKSKEIILFAEGVERVADVLFIKNTEIDGAQGYYFDRPTELSIENRPIIVND